MEIREFAAIGRIISSCFTGIWIIQGMVAFYLFYLRGDASFKRKWFPRYMILAGSFLAIFSSLSSSLSSGLPVGLFVLIFMIPATFRACPMLIKMTKFCDGCGATSLNLDPRNPTNFCPGCGTALDPKPKTYDDFMD